MHIHYQVVPEWPKLAWLAKCHRGTNQIDVLAGDHVEIHEDWFCEAVWAGDFAKGDFDQTDIVMGSGGKSREDGMVFVSSGSTVDRLQYLERDEGIWVSNSLVCLAALAGANLDPTTDTYSADLGSVVKGLKNYVRFLETSAGKIHFVYFDNLIWNRSALSVLEKPGGLEDFSCFEEYHDFLSGCLNKIAVNMKDPQRQNPYKFMGTLSSGYDSATCAVLAKPFGLDEVFSFNVGKRGLPDSGKPVADFLGFRVLEFDREAWRELSCSESLFLVADGIAMDIMFMSLEEKLDSGVLLTGYHGDKVWGKETKDLSRDLVRGDRSGLSLSEFRLKAGFINCAVPFFGVRQISDINKISKSEAMKSWDVAGGYSRPICRRIVENAGVPREAFAKRKNAAAHIFATQKEFLSRKSMEEYLVWLASYHQAFRRAGIRMPSWLNVLIDRLYIEFLHSTEKNVRKFMQWAPKRRLFWRFTANKRLKNLTQLTYQGRLRGFRRFVYTWAFERAKSFYPRP